MPRRDIEYAKGSYYHIFNRGANRVTLFRTEENFEYAVRLLRRYLEPLQVAVIAYCFMPNHYHWLIRQDSDIPARLLPQRVFNAYSKAFNNSYNRSGTLFEDRFRVILVETDEYLRHLCRYIHANPVRHGIAFAPELWPYSNYLDWIGDRSDGLVDTAFVAAHFHSPDAYKTYVRSYLSGAADGPKGIQSYLDELER